MDAHAYYNLKILNHLETAPTLTTRLAAGKLGVSVKLAHSVVRGLVHRGLIHVSRRDGRSLYYLLTPAGIAEKVRLTYEFLDFSTQFYREARRRSSEVCRRLAMAGVRRVAFLGASDLAEIAYLGIKEHGLSLAEVGDDAAAGNAFFGLVVRPTSELFRPEANPARPRFERILVTAFDPALPAREHYLPPGVAADDRFVWVFDQEEMVNESSGKVAAAAAAKKRL